MTKTFIYTAFSAQQDGETFEHTGTLEGARRKAIRYAKESFPSWKYNGAGPKIVVADKATGERLIEQKL